MATKKPPDVPPGQAKKWTHVAVNAPQYTVPKVYGPYGSEQEAWDAHMSGFRGQDHRWSIVEIEP